MIYKNKILAVIPARGGSKGIKLKNLKKINKKSLVEITAKFVSKCDVIDFAVLSTDHPKIAREGKKFGLSIIDRPKKLSGDKISDVNVLIHATSEIEKKFKKFDVIVMLHPTSPLRNINDLRKSIKLLISKKYDSVWTVSKTDTKFHPDKQLILKKNKIKFFTKKGSKIIYRQQLSNVYHRNSNAYVVKRDFLIKSQNLISRNTGAFIIKSKQVSIDTFEDLEKAKKYFN